MIKPKREWTKKVGYIKIRIMRKTKEMPGRKCPICGKTENQVNAEKIVRERKSAFAMTAENTTL